MFTCSSKFLNFWKFSFQRAFSSERGLSRSQVWCVLSQPEPPCPLRIYLASSPRWMSETAGAKQRAQSPSHVFHRRTPFHSWRMWSSTLHSPSLIPRRKDAIPLGRALPKDLTQFNCTTLSLADQGDFFCPWGNTSTTTFSMQAK